MVRKQIEALQVKMWTVEEGPRLEQLVLVLHLFRNQAWSKKVDGLINFSSYS